MYYLFSNGKAITFDDFPAHIYRMYDSIFIICYNDNDNDMYSGVINSMDVMVMGKPLYYKIDSDNNLTTIDYHSNDYHGITHGCYGYLLMKYMQDFIDDIKKINADSFYMIINKIENDYPMFIEICYKTSSGNGNTKSSLK